MLAIFSNAVKALEQTPWMSSGYQRPENLYSPCFIITIENCIDVYNLDLACREDFLGEWTKRGLVYRPDLTASIAKDCYMCQLHYLRYNLLIFEVRAADICCSLILYHVSSRFHGRYFLSACHQI